jgi:hypothetical protein
MQQSEEFGTLQRLVDALFREKKTYLASGCPAHS